MLCEDDLIHRTDMIDDVPSQSATSTMKELSAAGTPRVAL
jgi:hypothetical protein